MSKKRKKILKSMRKRIASPKYGHFHIRKSLVVALLSSCAILLGSITLSYANEDTANIKNTLLKNHFKSSIVKVDESKTMNKVLETIESVQKLQNKYVEILGPKITEQLGTLSKGEIAEKLAIVSNKLKRINYQDIIDNTKVKEEFAQLSALKHVLQSMYDKNHYSKNVNLSNLLQK